MSGTAFFAQSYWNGFVDFWKGSLAHQSAIVLIALGVAAVGVTIIASGRWKKP